MNGEASQWYLIWQSRFGNLCKLLKIQIDCEKSACVEANQKIKADVSIDKKFLDVKIVIRLKQRKSVIKLMRNSKTRKQYSIQN